MSLVTIIGFLAGQIVGAVVLYYLTGWWSKKYPIRVPIKEILADPVLRRKLMVGAIQAIQNREGIDTTVEQAERAYDKVQAEKIT